MLILVRNILLNDIKFRAGTLQVLMDHQGSLEYKTTLGFNKPQQLHRNPIYEGHPENPNRIDVCRNLLTECGLIKECQEVDTFPSLDDLDLRQTHTEGHVNRLLKEAISMDQDSLNHLCEDYDSVFMTPGSVEAAKSAVSCCRWLAESIVENKIPNAFALVRPPGHHADRYSACGFCLFNNAAQAAEAAFNFGADRILIVDLDIHHGQGTQQIFYEDKRFVLDVLKSDGSVRTSLRGWEVFGHIYESLISITSAIRKELTGCGDADYIAIFWNVLWPLAREFCPDFVIISAGFDSCDGDPLGEMRLSPDAYSHIVYHLRGLAHGKLLLILEGGYNHSVQSVGVHRCLRVLCGYKPLPISLVEPPKARHHPTISFEPPKEEEKENTSNVLQENLFKNEWHCKASTAPSKMLLVHNGDSSKHYNCVEEDHPEKPARTASIMAKLESCGLPSKCEVLLNERVATDSELEAVHERPYIQKMKRTAEVNKTDLLLHLPVIDG
ncbi:histone deacetylase family protein [Ancylostoma ceylanicum]|uniref:histone deacetylase n=1 Tax=Ancylostoma ceylanicum TaxID=53326 RepID=A0A0D6M7W5_9BILA|nr:histone deacetylase family protein [Ancylostoma ceylanicum]